jgi:hypothetical protein
MSAVVQLESPSAGTESPHAPKPLHKSQAYTVLLEIQRGLKARMDKETTSDKDFASLACAYDRIEERKRIMRGKPLPGSLRPSKEKPKQSRPRLMEIPDPSLSPTN